MRTHDAFGIWRFCEQSLEKSKEVSADFQRLWLAAKALQTCDSKSLPITGLIALLMGFTVIRGSSYDTVLPLSDVPAEKPGIDALDWLGAIPIENHTSQDIAIALRDWINHEEQFPIGRARVVRITLLCQSVTAVIEIGYSSKLPPEVLSPCDRIGSAATALNELRSVSQEVLWCSDTDTLTVVFPRNVT